MSRFIIDCDPGHDDAVAILFAARYLSLAGITTTHGNSSVENTTRNALSLCELAGLDLPVCMGAASPLTAAAVSGAVAHGKTGLDGADLPAPERAPHAQSAAEFLVDQISAQREEMTILAIGPLTNVATALTLEPRLAKWVGGISLMGGSLGGGNITPAAEFNIYSDPEAAAIVFDSGAALHMVGLNVTQQVAITEEEIARLASAEQELPRQLAGALQFYLGRQRALYGRDTAPLHDVCACLPFTHPELIDYVDAHVRVETRGEFTRGMTVCDLRGVRTTETGAMHAPLPPNTRVAIDARGSDIIRLVLETLLDYP